MVIKLRALDLCRCALQVVNIKFDVKLRLELDRLDGDELPSKFEHRSAIKRFCKCHHAVDRAVLVLVTVDDPRNLLGRKGWLGLSSGRFVVQYKLLIFSCSSRVLETLISAPNLRPTAIN